MSKTKSKLIITCLLAFAGTFTSFCSAAEEGIAAYYSNVFQGKKTASGEIYDKNKLTAAHKTLPFGTTVKVTDLDNNKTVIVTINDRGPYSKKRIIDLSYAAAEQIDLIKPGLSKVKLDIIEEAD